MYPFIGDGDAVGVRPVTPEEDFSGKVVLAFRHGRLMLHRCVRHDRCGGAVVHVAGDASFAQPDLVAEQDILGVAEWVFRRGHKRAIDHRFSRLLGLLWHHLRPLRKRYFLLRGGTLP